jgi:cytochrome c-type biogenesis protein CcmF
VLLGTLYPLFSDQIGGPKLTVGPPYFDFLFRCWMTPLLLALAVGPLLAWKRGDLLAALQRLWIAGVAALGIILVAFYVTQGGPVLSVLALGLAAWVFTGALVEWTERVKLARAPLAETWRRARHLPRATHGMTLAHIGMAVTVAGIAASAWQQERIETVKPGDDLPIAGYVLHLTGVTKGDGPNYTAETAEIAVTRDGHEVTVMHPERRFFPLQQMATSVTSIHTTLLADLYVALGQDDGKGGWTLRAYWKPLVPWIWIGAVLMALGGVISLSDRRWRVGVAARRLRAPAGAQAAE